MRAYTNLVTIDFRRIFVTTTPHDRLQWPERPGLNGGPRSVFTLSPVLEDLDELPQFVTIIGGPSSTAVLNDQNDQPAIGSTWTVNSSNVSRSSFNGTVFFSGLSGLTLNTDSRGDTVTVNITHTSGYNLTIHGGTGINTLNLFEVLGDRGGPFNPNPAPQGSCIVMAEYAAPGLVSTFTYTNMAVVNQLAQSRQELRAGAVPHGGGTRRHPGRAGPVGRPDPRRSAARGGARHQPFARGLRPRHHR